MKTRIGIVLTLALLVIGCALANGSGGGMEEKGKETPMPSSDKLKKATFAGGCFWCMEPAFDDVPGVLATVSGYTGGSPDFAEPSYIEVSSGVTGHAETHEATRRRAAALENFHTQQLALLQRQLAEEQVERAFRGRLRLEPRALLLLEGGDALLYLAE